MPWAWEQRLYALGWGLPYVEHPDEPALVEDMVWRALRQPDRDNTLFIHILAPDGTREAQRDLPLRAADYPSSRWVPGELVLDSADLDTSGLLPGVYRVLFGLRMPPARLPVGTGDTKGVLMTVTVE